MTDDASPENLRKFLESDDPALVRMGLSMAKGAEVSDEILEEILWMYLFHDDKAIRAAARSTFMKLAPEDLKLAVKENWKANYRTIESSLENNLYNLEKALSQTSVSLTRQLIKDLDIQLVDDDEAYRRHNVWLNQKDARVAAVVLEKLGWKPDTDGLRAAYLIAKQDWEGCIKLGEPAVLPLIKFNVYFSGDTWRFATRVKDIREHVVIVLGEIGDKRAVKSLIVALDPEDVSNGDYRVQKAAAEALSKIGDRRAVKPLIKVIRQVNDSELYAAAAYALGKIGDRRAVEPFIKELLHIVTYDSGYGSTCEITIEMLGKFGGAQVVEPLIKTLGVLSDDSRTAAHMALLEIGKPEPDKIQTVLDVDKNNRPEYNRAVTDVVPSLIKALGDDNALVREAAAKILEELGWKPDPREGTHIANLIAKQDWEGCIKLGESAVLPLIKVLGSDDWKTCASAAEALAEIGDERSVDPLIKVLPRRVSDEFTTSRSNQRSAAIKALRKFGDKRAVKPLSELLDDKMGCIARDAAEALGDIGDARAVEPLIKALGNDDLGVRDVVVKALDKLKWKPDTDRPRAAYLIAKQDWEECIKLGEPAVLPLIKILRFETGAPPNVAYENLWGKPRRAYRDLSVNVANESVIESLGPLRPSYQAVLALGKIGDVRAVEALIEALGVTYFHSRLREELKDSDINKAAAEALWELGEDAVESLIKALGNDDADIRQATDKFLTTKFLKAVLEERGLPISGTKAALIQRLKSVKVDDTGGIKPLIKSLDNMDPNARCAAVVALGKLSDREGVEPLLKVISDVDSNVRKATVKVLGDIGDVRAVEPLIKALKDGAKGVRLAAVKALENIGDARAVEPLIKALGDKNRDILKAATNALSNIGDRRAVEPLRNILEDEDSLDVLEVVKEALKNLGHETVGLDGGAKKSAKNLRKFLESDDPALRKMGFSIAKGSGVPKELLPTILGLYMWDDDRSVRGGAKSVFTKYAPAELQAKVKKNWKPSYRTLSISGDRFPDAIRPFLEAFKSQDVFSDIALKPLIKALHEKPVDDRVSYLAAETLGKIGEPAMELLIKALGNRNKYVRRNAAEALGKIDARSVEPLIGALEDDNKNVRMAAVMGLGKIGGARAVEALIKVLRNNNSLSVCRYTVAALDKLGWEPDTDEHRIVYLVAKRDWNAIILLGARAVGPLVKMLGDGGIYARGDAAIALGMIGNARPDIANSVIMTTEPAVVPLIKALGDDYYFVRMHVAGALGRIGDTRAVKPLIKAISDEDSWMNNASAAALINKHTTLIVSDASDLVRQGAAVALGEIGDTRAVKPLIGMLSDDDWQVRASAAGALGEIGDERAVESLIKAGDGMKGQYAYERDRVLNAAKEALKKLGHEE